MKNFIVSADAAADLSLQYITEHDVKVISMNYIIKDKDALSWVKYHIGNGEEGLTYAEFYSKLREGAEAKTTLINQEEHVSHFLSLLKENKNILHIPLSCGISGTAENAYKAAAEVNAKCEGANVVVVDALCGSLGIGLCVDYLVGIRDAGGTIEEGAEWAKANTQNICHYFTVDDLGFLRRGGRISGVSAFIGTLIKIKPLLHADKNGKLVAIGKNIGRKRSLHNLVENMEKLITVKNQRVFISHADSLEDATLVAELVEEKLGISDIAIGEISPIIGAHSGPGTVALFFLGKNR